VYFPLKDSECVLTRVRNNTDALRGLMTLSVQFSGNTDGMALRVSSKGISSFFSSLRFSVILPLSQRQHMSMAEGRGFQK